MKKNQVEFLLALLMLGMTGIANAQTILLSENFSTDSIPPGFSQDSAGVTPYYPWTFNNPAAEVITGAGFDTSFVIFDSDHDGQNNSQDCYLNVPAVNASSFSTLYLVMDEQYRSTQNQYHQIEISTDSGVTWTHLLTDSTSDVGYPVATHSVYNISSIAAGHSSVNIRFHFAASWGWWWAIDNLKITDIENCTSPPDAGQSVSGSAFVCSTDTFTLSLTNNSVGVGETFQWQLSADGLSWTDILSATSENYSLVESNTTYYHCVVSCSGMSSVSDSVRIDISPNLFCYCIPYNLLCNGLDYITAFTIIGTPMNDSTGCDSSIATNYMFIAPDTNTTATLTAGLTYSFIVATNNNDIVSIWIDYNHNYIFDPDEWTQVCTTSLAGVSDTVNITIPVTAGNGLTGLRIRSRLSGSPNDGSSACISMGSGQTQDYLVTIVNGINIGINEPTKNKMTVYPNPSTGQVEIIFGNIITDKTLIEVIDLPGNILMKKYIDHSSSAHLDVSELANGIYFVKTETGSGVFVQKIVLNK